MAAAVDAGAITVQWGDDEAQLHISDVVDTSGSVSEFADMLVSDKVQYATWWSVGVSGTWMSRRHFHHDNFVAVTSVPP